MARTAEQLQSGINIANNRNETDQNLIEALEALYSLSSVYSWQDYKTQPVNQNRQTPQAGKVIELTFK